MILVMPRAKYRIREGCRPLKDPPLHPAGTTCPTSSGQRKNILCRWSERWFQS